jgi:hypothetical protein
LLILHAKPKITNFPLSKNSPFSKIANFLCTNYPIKVFQKLSHFYRSTFNIFMFFTKNSLFTLPSKTNTTQSPRITPHSFNNPKITSKTDDLTSFGKNSINLAKKRTNKSNERSQKLRSKKAN